MNAPAWMRHAALLDQQPSNRRLVQQVTPRWQSVELQRMHWSDQIESGAGIAGLIVWAASVAVLLYTLWGNP